MSKLVFKYGVECLGYNVGGYGSHPFEIEIDSKEIEGMTKEEILDYVYEKVTEKVNDDIYFSVNETYYKKII